MLLLQWTSPKMFPILFFPLCSLRAWRKNCCTKECIGNNKYYCCLLAKKAAGAPFTSKEDGFNLYIFFFLSSTIWRIYCPVWSGLSGMSADGRDFRGQIWSLLPGKSKTLGLHFVFLIWKVWKSLAGLKAPNSSLFPLFMIFCRQFLCCVKEKKGNNGGEKNSHVIFVLQQYLAVNNNHQLLDPNVLS